MPIVEAIQPVLEISSLSQIGKIDTIALDMRTGGWKNGFTVPLKKRWRVQVIGLAATAGETQIRISPGNDGATYSNLSAYGTGAKVVILGGLSFIAEAGFQFGAPGTGNAGDGSINMTIWYIEEDLG
jgi:hypothetical protein